MDVTKELRMLHENILNSDKSLRSLYTQLCKYTEWILENNYVPTYPY